MTMQRYIIQAALIAALLLVHSANTTRANEQIEEVHPVSSPAASDGVSPVAFDGETITNSIGMKLVSIKPGEFWMGSSDNEEGHSADESPQHLVKLTKGFYVCVTEVTQAQWLKVMKSRSWSGKKYVREGDSYPATYVSWDDAIMGLLDDYELDIGCFDGLTYGQRISTLATIGNGLYPP